MHWLWKLILVVVMGKWLFGRDENDKVIRVMEIVNYFEEEIELEDVRGLVINLPHQPGIYGWYFNPVPPKVPHGDCTRVNGWTLLYVGIATKDIRQRILDEHFHGNAYGSTLRLSLGCLLTDILSIQLRRIGRSRKRLTFGQTGEVKLSEWMAKHARVAWRGNNELFQDKRFLKKLERLIVQERYSLPLNMNHNKKHPFYAQLKKIRKDCRKKALRS